MSRESAESDDRSLYSGGCDGGAGYVAPERRPAPVPPRVIEKSVEPEEVDDYHIRFPGGCDGGGEHVPAHRRPQRPSGS